ncbi:MAG: regulator, partial [Mycolicibacterium neoaurum]|nr:regulator [Mycolicibacterium neoaurum]
MSTEITDPPVEPSPAAPAPTVAWWTRGDTNAFFGLGFNILVNVLTLTGLMIGVIAVPAGDVLGTVLPALGVALILGNLYYTFLARRLAKRENRSDVTALPYGPSVP